MSSDDSEPFQHRLHYRGWGYAPYPLLPSAIRDHYVVRAAAGRRLPTVRFQSSEFTPIEFDSEIWNQPGIQQESIDALEEAAIYFAKMAAHHVLDISIVKIASGDLSDVIDLPLRTRSFNICRAAKLQTIGQIASTTFGQLLSIPNCGIRSVLDLACSIEGHLRERRLIHPTIATIEPTEVQIDPVVAPPAIQFLNSLSGDPSTDGLSHPMLVSAREVNKWSSEQRTQRDDCLALHSDLDLLTQTLGNSQLGSLYDMLTRSLDDRQHVVLRERLLMRQRRPTLEDLGQRFDVTRERIRQIESKLERRLRGGLAAQTLLPLIRVATMTRLLLGIASPTEDAEVLMRTLNAIDPSIGDRAVADLLLWIAGPYRERDGWLLSESNADGETINVLKQVNEDVAFITPEAATQALAPLGLSARVVSRWVTHLERFERVDEGWIFFHGSIVNKCVQWIKYRQTPVGLIELARVSGTDSVRSLRNRLSEDTRVKRVNRQADFVLSEWEQYDEYTGIAEEILQEIERLGGAAPLDHLVRVISERYGVKADSVRLYAAAPMFIQASDRMVRVRHADQRLVIDVDPADCTGCYFVDGAWLFRIEINSDTLRGSGRPIPAGFAVATGCQPGDKRSYLWGKFDIVISWPETAASGPAIGSLRHIAESANLVAGDFLFVGVMAGEGVVRSVPRARLDELSTTEHQVLRMIGADPYTVPKEEVWDTVMIALGGGDDFESPTKEDARRMMLARNEQLLLIYMNEQGAESAEQALSRIGALLT